MNYVGTRYRLTCEFKDFDKTLADPDTVAITINGASFTPVRDSTGKYHYDFLPASSGTYVVRWLGAGAVGAAAKITLDVLSNLQ